MNAVSRAKLSRLIVIRKVVAWIFCLLTLALFLPGAAAARHFEPLEIESAAGTHRFQVELALDDESRQRGLMERPSLAPDRGMLFIFEPRRRVAMWMKDTWIPLDMLFIDAAGVIRFVAPMREPHSLDITASPEPVRAVLEIRGGRAAELGIAAGDRVRHRLLGTAGQQQ